MRKFVHFGFALTVVVMLMSGPLLGQDASPVGKIENVVNRLYAARVGQILRVGDDVSSTQRLRTGRASAAHIKFSENSRLILGERSDAAWSGLSIGAKDTAPTGSFTLTRGLMRLGIGQAGARQFNGELNVKTRHALFNIQSGRFDIFTGARHSELALHEGEADLLLPSGIHRIAAGQHFVVTANGQGLFQPSPSIALRTALDKSENMIGAIKRPAKAITESETEASPPAEDVVVKTTTAPIPLIDEDETVEVAAVSAEEAEAEAESETVATKPEPATEALSDLIKAALKGRDPDNFLILDTTKGQVVIEMRPDLAPRHVARIRELVRARFYDRVSFHHVREGFVAETGDPTGKGTGGSGQTLKAEISKQPFEAGVVGMKRDRKSIDTGDSQFFIMLGRAAHLDGKYTVWGQVKLGLEHIKKLVPGAPPPRPDRILTARLAADLIDKTEEN